MGRADGAAVLSAPFRLAVVSDVHADVHALIDALAAIDRLGCDAIVCCGDIVDYGLFPDETIALLVERGVRAVRGNHDRWAIASGSDHGGGFDLDPASRRFLVSLPASLQLELEGVRVAIHHDSPRGDMDGILPEELDGPAARQHLDNARADVLLVGHTHVAFCVEIEGGGVVANPSALLRAPAEGADNPPATGAFGVLELPARRFTVHRAVDGAEVSIIRRRLAVRPS